MHLEKDFQTNSVMPLTPRQAKMVKTHIRKLLLFGLSMMILTATRASAQERPQVFALPDASAREAYSANIEDVLREKYKLRIEGNSPRAIVLWSIADGKLPPGLSVGTDGLLVGTPTYDRTDNYSFRLKAVDVAVKDEELILNFTLAVKPARLRLTKIEGPRLVAVEMRQADSNSGAVSERSGSSPVETDRPVSPEINRTDSQDQTKDVRAKLIEKRAVKEKKDTEQAASNPISSLNKRFILGFEQTGAAASNSTGKPFFDIFINTPLSRNGCKPPHENKPDAANKPKTDASDKKKPADSENGEPGLKPECLPRFSIWGDVRLTSTATQVNALADVVSAAVPTITGDKVNQLASAFDFTVGPEIRLAAIHNNHVSLIAGFGAVSPISPRDSAQIFEVPKPGSSQAARFFDKYPGAKDKDQIAFINPDRDRFLRQYFGGLRFRSYNLNDAGEVEQTFPAMFDVTFGQNEAITEGRFHKFVVGFDGFYPLPFPDKKRFLYLFGSARLKAGGPKNHDTPFILDTAASSVKITDPKVFIADPTPTNRDTWRIGFGVDLFELFKFTKAQAIKEGEQNTLDATNPTPDSGAGAGSASGSGSKKPRP
jgi:hypothetical protein